MSGLPNLGQNCYCNVVFQLISSIPSAVEILSHHYEEHVERSCAKCTLCCMLLSLNSSDKDLTLSQDEFLCLLRDLDVNYTLAGDPREFLVNLCREKVPVLQMAVTLNISRKVTCSTCQVVSHAEPQPELHLTLPSGFRTIQEGLNDYFSVSQGPQYNCERCRTQTTCLSQLQLRDHPNYIIMHNNGAGILAPQEDVMIDQFQYKLEVFVELRGSTATKKKNTPRHYICYRKLNGSWLKFDDKFISVVDLHKTYKISLMLYRRIDTTMPLYFSLDFRSFKFMTNKYRQCTPDKTTDRLRTTRSRTRNETFPNPNTNVLTEVKREAPSEQYVKSDTLTNIKVELPTQKYEQVDMSSKITTHIQTEPFENTSKFDNDILSDYVINPRYAINTDEIEVIDLTGTELRKFKKEEVANNECLGYVKIGEVTYAMNKESQHNIQVIKDLDRVLSSHVNLDVLTPRSIRLEQRKLKDTGTPTSTPAKPTGTVPQNKEHRENKNRYPTRKQSSEARHKLKNWLTDLCKPDPTTAEKSKPDVKMQFTGFKTYGLGKRKSQGKVTKVFPIKRYKAAKTKVFHTKPVSERKGTKRAKLPKPTPKKDTSDEDEAPIEIDMQTSKTVSSIEMVPRRKTRAPCPRRRYEFYHWNVNPSLMRNQQHFSIFPEGEKFIVLPHQQIPGMCVLCPNKFFGPTERLMKMHYLSVHHKTKVVIDGCVHLRCKCVEVPDRGKKQKSTNKKVTRNAHYHCMQCRKPCDQRRDLATHLICKHDYLLQDLAYMYDKCPPRRTPKVTEFTEDEDIQDKEEQEVHDQKLQEDAVPTSHVRISTTRQATQQQHYKEDFDDDDEDDYDYNYDDEDYDDEDYYDDYY